MKRKLFALALTLTILATGCGAASTPSTSNSDNSKTTAQSSGATKGGTLKIGALFPLTGNQALLGNESLYGTAVAVDLINEKGGVLGQKVELVKGDASAPDKAQSEAERLISQEGLKIITGTYSSGLSFAASQVAERHGVIYWESGGTADTLTQRGFKNYFRITYTAGANGQLAANLAKDVIAPQLGAQPKDLKVLVIHEDSEYGTTVAAGAEAKGKANGFNVVGKIPYKSSSSDLSPLVLQMKSAQPDIVIASSYANDALLIQRQMKQLNVNVKAFIGTGGIYGLEDFAKGLGSDVNGIFDTQGSLGINEKGLTKDAQAMSAEFKSRYKAKYQKDPSFLAGQAFVATYILLHDVLPAAGTSDPEKVIAAALNVDIPEGSTILGWGAKFAGPGDSMAGTNTRVFPVASQWQDGKEVVVYPASVANGQAKMIPLPEAGKR